MIRQLVPRFIRERYVRGEPGGQLQAAVLFVDISGFSGLADELMQHGQHGAEVLADVMRAVFDPMVTTVFQRGGFIATFAGDAFTAIFPVEVPVAPPSATALQTLDPAARALAAALQIQERLHASSKRETAYGSFTLSAKAGIGYGEVQWGIVRSDDDSRAVYYFRGEAIDSSAAAEHQANAGDVILDSNALQAVRKHVVAVPVDSHSRVTAVVEPLPEAVSINGPGPGYSTSEGTAPDADIMAHFFPAEVITLEHGGEFRQTVNVFLSLPTVRNEQQLAVFMQSLFDLQLLYGGLLNRLDFGDKGSNVLMFWGAPRAFENDIQRAIELVLDLQERTSIPIKAGITYQIAHTGFIGGSLAEDYTAYGRGINLAARFMTSAGRTEIWVDEPVAHKARRWFELDFLGEQAFKGFSDKQPVYVVFERKEEVEAFVPGEGEMVGRQAELEQLAAFLDPLWDGDDASPGLAIEAGHRLPGMLPASPAATAPAEGRRRFAGLMIVWGEAGMGKSLLLQALRESEDARRRPPPLWALCQADETVRHAFHPFRFWLRHYFGQSHGVSEARNKRSFNRALDGLLDELEPGPLAEDLDRTRSFLGALVDLYWPDSLYEQVEARDRSENMTIGITRLLQAESQRQPVVLVMEDAQWLDEESIDLVRRLFPVLGGPDTRAEQPHDMPPSSASTSPYPVAIIATARREELASGPAGPAGPQAPEAAQLSQRPPSLADLGYRLANSNLEYRAVAEISLEALSQLDIAQLAGDVLGGAGSPQLLDLIQQRAEGNPFFAEQFLRYLQEENLLVQEPSGWALNPARYPTLHSIDLPVDVKALLIARLDRLARQVRDLVQTAAVLGRRFEVQVLAQMLRDERELPSRLAEAETASIWNALSQLRYLFRHALIRDAAYGMLVRARRTELHELAAHSLRLLAGDDQAPHYRDLAYHYAASGNREEERRFAFLAGAQAAAQYANAEAIRYLSRALELTPEADLGSRYQLLLEMEELHDRLGNRAAQASNLAALVSLADSLDDPRLRGRVALRRANLARLTADYATARNYADEAIAQAQLAGDLVLLSQAYDVSGRILIHQNHYAQAVEFFRRGMAKAEEVGDQGSLAHSLYALANAAALLGQVQTAETHYGRARQLFNAVGDRRGQINSLLMLGRLRKQAGDYVEAHAVLVEALALCREMGWRHGEAYTLGLLGNYFFDTGDYERTLEYHQEALAVCQEIEDREGEANSLDTLGLTYQMLGDAGEALRIYSQALGLQEEIGDRRGLAFTLTHQGYALLTDVETGPKAATGSFEQALAIRRELGEEALAVDDLVGLVQVALAQGDMAQGLALVQEVMAWLELNSPAHLEFPAIAFLACYKALSAHAVGSAARARFEDQALRMLQLGHVLVQERAQTIQDSDLRHKFLENVPYNRELISLWQLATSKG